MKKTFFLDAFIFSLLGAFVLFSFLESELPILVFKTPVWVSYFSIFLFAFGIIIIFLGIFNLKYSKGDLVAVYNNNFRFRGIYKYIRHPSYVGMLLLLLAFSLYHFSIIKIVITLLLWGVLYLKSKAEDEILESQFDFYKEYNKNVGRFFPKFKKR